MSKILAIPFILFLSGSACATATQSMGSKCSDLFFDVNQNQREYQKALFPEFKIDKTNARIDLDWTAIATSLQARLNPKKLIVRIIQDGVEGQDLPEGQTTARLQFARSGEQHDAVVQFRDQTGKIIHETLPVLLESYKSQMVDASSFVAFSEQRPFAVKFPLLTRNAAKMASLVETTTKLGYRKLVWILTDQATPNTRLAAAEFGVNLKVVAKMDDAGNMTGFQLFNPNNHLISTAAANELRVQNDAAFNGNGFFWDNQFVSLSSGLHHLPLSAATLDFHYGTQIKMKNGSIPREVRHSNLISYHRPTDVKFGKERENDEFANPNFTGWVERYLFALSDPNQGAPRLSRSLKSLTDYAAWIELTRSVVDPDGKLIGYWTSNLGSGADNAPRNNIVGWVDLLAQQMMVYKDIGEIHALRGEWSEAQNAWSKSNVLKDLLNHRYWDENQGFYFDLISDGKGGTKRDTSTATQAGFWPFLAAAADSHQVQRFADMQLVEGKFGGKFPAASLSSSHPLYSGVGQYWRGGRWPPSFVILAQGLENSGRPDLAFVITRNFTSSMAEVSDKTVYEFYGERTVDGRKQPIVGEQPNHTTRSDFTGWGKTPFTYSLPRHLIGLRPVPAYLGQDPKPWLVHLSQSTQSHIGSFPRFLTGTSSEKIVSGYLEWNLVIDPKTPMILKNFTYKGNLIRRLSIQRLSDDNYRLKVDSKFPLTLQINRLFDFGSGKVAHQPYSGSPLVEVGGPIKSIVVNLALP